MNIYNKFEKDRKKERCRNCIYFNQENIICRIRNGWRLTKGERLKGCYRFQGDLWGNKF